MPFKELSLHTSLLDNIDALGFNTPTPIQEQVIPAAIKGQDLLGIAKTGSGKTASFVLPILHQLLNDDTPTKKTRAPKVLVLAPTRELAIQVTEVFRSFSKNLPKPIKSLAVYGGVSINPQMKSIFGTDILIATPGRLLDLESSNAVELSKVEVLVLDEADKILNLGFKEEMETILSRLPEQRQSMLFSATLSEKLKQIKKVFLAKPAVFEIKEQEEDIALINLSGYFVSDKNKGPFLRYLIREKRMQQVLVFASSRQKADKVAGKLNKNGIQADSIHGKRSQTERMDILEKFKSNKLRVLVATDLISRGIDINELPFVINYELPRSPKDFVHRVGRTGRANSEGLAITFVTREETHHLKVILKKMKRYMDIVDTEEMDF